MQGVSGEKGNCALSELECEKEAGKVKISLMWITLVGLLTISGLSLCNATNQKYDLSKTDHFYEHHILGVVAVHHLANGDVLEVAHALHHVDLKTKAYVIKAGREGIYTKVISLGDCSRVYTLATEPSMYRDNPPSSWHPATEKTWVN